MRETEKLAKTINDGMDMSIKVTKWLIIGTIVIIIGGALIATLASL